MPAAAMAGMAVASAAAGYIGRQKAAQGAQDAAAAYARAMSIPFYGPGEKIQKHTMNYLQEKYGSGAPINARPSSAALSAGPYGDVLAKGAGVGALGSVYAAPSALARNSRSDVGSKQFNTGLGAAYKTTALNDMNAVRGQRAGFDNWQQGAYGHALSMGQGNPMAASDYLAQQIGAAGSILGDYLGRNRNNTQNPQTGDYAVMDPRQWRQ